MTKENWNNEYIISFPDKFLFLINLYIFLFLLFLQGFLCFQYISFCFYIKVSLLLDSLACFNFLLFLFFFFCFFSFFFFFFFCFFLFSFFSFNFWFFISFFLNFFWNFTFYFNYLELLKVILLPISLNNSSKSSSFLFLLWTFDFLTKKWKNESK